MAEYECIPGPNADPRCNFDVGSPNLFTGDFEFGSPGYVPTLWVCALFLALFSLSLVAHIGQAIHRKLWWAFGTFVCCGIAEVLGWAGRLWMNRSFSWRPQQGGSFGFNDTSFLLQISTLIFAPAFLAAGLYLTLGHIIRLRGQQYCRFHYRTYAIVFMTGDVLSIVIQAVGGGIASAADDLEGAENGAKIMVGGIFVQVAVMVAFTWILLEFIWRQHYDRPVKMLSPFAWAKCWGRNKQRNTVDPQATRENIPLSASGASSVVEEGKSQDVASDRSSGRGVAIQLGALSFSVLVIFVRSIFRAIELLDGWEGKLVKDQTLFNVLDGLMIVLAMLALNIFHPGYLLPPLKKK